MALEHTATAILRKYPTFDSGDFTDTDDVATYIAKSIQPKTQTNAMEALGLMAKKSSVPTLKGAPTAPIDPMTAYVNAIKLSLA
jgi:hypothetical protein